MIRQTIHAIIPHFERLEALKSCLASLFGQRFGPGVNLGVTLVLDDSRPALQPEILRVCGLSADPVWFQHREGKPQWSTKFNAAVYTELPQRKPLNFKSTTDLILICSCDFVLAPDFLTTAVRALSRLPEKALVLAPGLNRSDEKAATRGGLVNPTTGDKEIKIHHHADNGMLWLFHARDAQTWDESYDEIGFGHQVPDWLYRMQRHGTTFWRCDELQETHIEHHDDSKDEGRAQEVERSRILYFKNTGF